GVGLELGRSKDRAVEEPETQPRLEVKPPGPEVKETEPPPPAAPSKAEDKAQKRKRQRTEKTSRALREAERKRVLEVVKSGETELDQIAAETNMSERVCKRRLRELEREGLLESDGAPKWSLKGYSKKRDFDMGM
ncbi:MAG: winged helix-turn-helix transcriptional regulator, partial [Myxococcota bacterium]